MEFLTVFFQEANILSVVILIIASIMTGLMAVIGYFLKQANVQLKELAKAIVDLQISLGREQTNVTHLTTLLDTHCRNSERKMDDLDKRTDDHELRIVVLEEKTKNLTS